MWSHLIYSCKFTSDPLKINLFNVLTTNTNNLAPLSWLLYLIFPFCAWKYSFPSRPHQRYRHCTLLHCEQWPSKKRWCQKILVLFQHKLFSNITPKYLCVLTLTTTSPFIQTGFESLLLFLKSTHIPFISKTFRYIDNYHHTIWQNCLSRTCEFVRGIVLYELLFPQCTQSHHCLLPQCTQSHHCSSSFQWFLSHLWTIRMPAVSSIHCEEEGSKYCTLRGPHVSPHNSKPSSPVENPVKNTGKRLIYF